MKRYTKAFLYVVFVSVVFTVGAGALIEKSFSSSNDRYATWGGLGPDKWASVWLIQRHISPSEKVAFIPEGSHVEGLTLFDIPGSRFFRKTDVSTFEQLRSGVVPNNVDLETVSAIIHDIEINLWMPDKHSISSHVEKAYRALQDRYHRVDVPFECYMRFFDKVENTISEEIVIDSYAAFLPDKTCADSIREGVEAGPGLVAEMPIKELLGYLRNGKKVVFVDVREPEEYAEQRIPGAVNFMLRDAASTQSVNFLQDADLVVTYCVKDFRAYEMAKKLHSYGIDKAVILNPYGLKGWISAGLPVVGVGALTEEQGFNELSLCVGEADDCQMEI